MPVHALFREGLGAHSPNDVTHRPNLQKDHPWAEPRSLPLLYTKFDDSSFSSFRDMTGTSKYYRPRDLTTTCPPPVAQWSKHLGAMCSRWGFKPQSGSVLPPTKKLFLIISMHMINREIIPGRKKQVRRCPL